MSTSLSGKGTFAFQLEGESHLLQMSKSSYPHDDFGQRMGGKGGRVRREEEEG